MPNIIPISDLRNYSNVIKKVSYGNRVYLTKNGRGMITMIDTAELDELEKQIALYKFRLAMQEAEASVREEGTVSIETLKQDLGVND